MVDEYLKAWKDAHVPEVYKGSELYDTIVDVKQTTKIFVTYRDAQAYPQYWIKYNKRL